MAQIVAINWHGKWDFKAKNICDSSQNSCYFPAVYERLMNHDLLRELHTFISDAILISLHLNEEIELRQYLRVFFKLGLK